MKNIKNLLLKTIILISLLLFITYVSIDIKSEELVLDSQIEVEIRGEVLKPGIYKLESGSNYQDIFDLAILNNEADISSYSLQNVLYNKELIIVPKKQEKQLISINSATIEQLCSLPGIGVTIAQRIIDYRNNIGSFLDLEQLKEVKGIGENKFNKIKEYITL